MGWWKAEVDAVLELESLTLLSSTHHLRSLCMAASDSCWRGVVQKLTGK
jgi:predicted secreted protein